MDPSSDPSSGWTAAVEFRLRDAQTGSPLGTMSYTLTDDRGSVQRRGNILYTRPQSSNPSATMQGWWYGNAMRVQCAGSCGNKAEVLLGPRREILLAISQVGSMLTGTVNGSPVQGSVSGNRLSLAGGYTLSTCTASYDGNVCSTRVAVEGSVDRLDRMTGTIEYQVEGFSTGSSASHFQLSARADLVGVVRWP